MFQDGFDQCYKMHEIVGGIGGKTRVLVASLRDVVNMQVLAQKGAGEGKGDGKAEVLEG